MNDDGPSVASGEEHVVGPVVVGVDGSENAGRALVVAAELARATGAELIAIHALGLMSTIDGEHVPSAAHRDELAERLRREWCAVLEGAAAPAWRCSVVDGSPAEGLLHAASEHGAAFVVVGSRGLGGHPDLMLGSTSHQVIQHAHCPAVVVPPAGRAPAHP